MKRTLFFCLCIALALAGSTARAQPDRKSPALTWPAVTQQTRPWTRWWWMGSAVNDADLSLLLAQYRQAGLGGVEITPIYGVKDTENQFINFLSPTWMNRLTHTLTEANRLGLGVDLAQASGWPFGGPWVTSADACKTVAYRTYTLRAGQRLAEPIACRQTPLVRTVGEKIDISQLTEPVAQNPDLQRHAFDQVRFAKALPLQSLMAYPEPDAAAGETVGPATGKALDLTAKVDAAGNLNWTAPSSHERPVGNWTLYAVFQGWHGKQVERAGPGGEGDVIDHFSQTATQHYLRRFDQAFRGRNLATLRAFFNDSYEVDDAQGEANWTPALFAEFQRRRGYDLRQHLPALFGPHSVRSGHERSGDSNNPILSDYRETISELLLENYTKTWGDWAKRRGKLIRNQAHGSPANILDLYALTDIPEIEGTDLLRIKMASSAAHVTGKPLTSAETATWNNEHFLSKLSDVKHDVDRMLLGGVNHVFYHGTNYSPPDAAWPGWLFYAAVHINPNNPFWTDFGTLNQYVSRCQSFLQTGQPDNDLLLYLPIYDAFAGPRSAKPATGRPNAATEPALLQHFDGIEHGFKGLPVEKHASMLLQKGYSFDFVSDKQLLGVTTTGGRLQTGGNQYRAIVIPDARLMPLATLRQLLKLAQNGATVVFADALPTDVNGFANLANRRDTLKTLLAGRSGMFLVGPDLALLLTTAGVGRETMVDNGLQYIRRTHATGHYYFIVNGSEKAVHGWISLQKPGKSAALFNPMTGQSGLAPHQASNGIGDVYLQLAPGESGVLQTTDTAIDGPAYPHWQPTGPPQPIAGTWTIRFVTGGPTLPNSLKTNVLQSWTMAGDSAKAFSGTADYTITFAKPTGTGLGWWLDLGQVAESARVALNGQSLGTLIGPTFRLYIRADQFKENNTLTVSVSNGMANRIIDMDRNHLPWKKFYNINMSARLRENRDANGLFTAERWAPRESGLLGPVTLTPVKASGVE